MFKTATYTHIMNKMVQLLIFPFFLAWMCFLTNYVVIQNNPTRCGGLVYIIFHCAVFHRVCALVTACTPIHFICPVFFGVGDSRASLWLYTANRRVCHPTKTTTRKSPSHMTCDARVANPCVARRVDESSTLSAMEIIMETRHLLCRFFYLYISLSVFSASAPIG